MVNVWWPYDSDAVSETWPPNKVRGFRLWWDDLQAVLFLEIEDSSQPKTDEEVRIWYAKRQVIQDLDEDGFEGTGWAIQYMHVESRDRVAAGTYLERGDPVGHPSCEGGISSGTHLHLSRKYNGEWIPADGPLPHDLDGWTSTGDGAQYNGVLTRGDIRLEACSCRLPFNQIAR